MKNLLRADLRRLFHNIFYVSCCILAFLITWYYTRNGAQFGIQYNANANQYMVFVSAGVLAFFSIFPALFQSTEYGDGVIKNKIAVGHKQTSIYLSQFITICVAAFIMVLCWLGGGLLAGAQMDRGLLKYTCVLFFYSMAYVSVMTCICMRITKMAIAIGLQIMIFQFSFNAALILNGVFAMTEGSIAKAAQVMLNFIPMGQWISNTSLVDDTVTLGLFPQTALSFIVVAVFFGMGMFRLNKREIK